MPCANGCGHTVPRKPEHFFALLVSSAVTAGADKQSDFPTYTQYLASIIEQSCPRCQQVTCLACGQPANGKDKAKPSRTGEIESLFHCSNIQVRHMAPLDLTFTGSHSWRCAAYDRASLWNDSRHLSTRNGLACSQEAQDQDAGEDGHRGSWRWWRWWRWRRHD